MNRIKIIADSTCDLSPQLRDKYDVDIVPLFVCLGDKTYRDGTEITPDEVYQLVNDGKFAEALNKLKTDSRYAAMPSPALQEWVLQVQSHLDFDRAVNGLIMNALANLRLKEFSRH